MDNDSTTEDANSAAAEVDELDLSAEDNAGNDSNASTDDTQTGDDANDLASEAAAAEGNSAEDTTDGKKAPAFDNDLAEWAEKKGYEKPDNERERKLLQDLRNSEREFTRSRQTETSADLSKAIKDANPAKESDNDSVDPLEKEVASLQAQLRAINSRTIMKEYLDTNPISDQEQVAMKEVLEERVRIGGQKAFDYLTDPDNLGDWHALAKARLANPTADTTEAIEKAKQQERERLAKTTKAAGPTRSAHSMTPAKKEDELATLWKSDD